MDDSTRGTNTIISSNIRERILSSTHSHGEAAHFEVYIRSNTGMVAEFTITSQTKAAAISQAVRYFQSEYGFEQQLANIWAYAVSDYLQSPTHPTVKGTSPHLH